MVAFTWFCPTRERATDLRRLGLLPGLIFAAAALVPAAVLAQAPVQDPPPAAAAPTPAPAAPPATAAVALDRAAAAYEYGDMYQVVAAARAVTEGALPASDEFKARALRFLGIGLHLTGQIEGAETAFVQLLRLRPQTRLDPTTTRPEVVAFLEDVRRRHGGAIERERRAEIRSRKSFLWTLLPPVGQFQNGDLARGIIIAGLEAASLGVALTTNLVLSARRHPDGTFNDDPAARRLKTWNHISVAALAVSYAAGVIDAMLRFDRDPDEQRSVEVAVLPGGAALLVRF